MGPNGSKWVGMIQNQSKLVKASQKESKRVKMSEKNLKRAKTGQRCKAFTDYAGAAMKPLQPKQLMHVSLEPLQALEPLQPL